MRLTTRGKMAVTAITDLASRSHGHPVALPSISARQGISLSYLEDIFSALRRAGLVRSIRGPGGGYTLARPASDVSIADIVKASDRVMNAEADENGNLREDSPSGKMTAELWTNFHSRVLDYLQSVTVADLVAQQSVVQSAERTRDSATRLGSAVKRLKGRTSARTQFPAQNVPNSVFALAAVGLRS
ncbi:Rrf2 family transcriptional regulator [Diaphorobacter aerolatus]|uniref:Rrf2 family transcriptional regulator n=1 Tax=Diaphorobacter aerolatus TaxID=1288495 RepID=A0A7H0GK69_9BURK|nr:Rrf2 family transcriptional regulator [Diaphorobacter aerolatus]QNP48685.1 Rrf2 family transcriptional regulator [Diaphorobacter aerolatus]